MATGELPGKSFGLFEAFVAEDGTLLVPAAGQDGGSRWYASRDGGRSFTPVADMPSLSHVVRLSGGYFAESTADRRTYHLSEDGLRWRTLDVP